MVLFRHRMLNYDYDYVVLMSLNSRKQNVCSPYNYTTNVNVDLRSTTRQ